MLNFELLRQVRGQNASFFGANFSRAFKTMIFGLLGGSGAGLGPPGVAAGVQNLKLLNFEPIRQVRGVFASFLGADFNRGVKTLIFDLFGGSGAVFGTPGGTLGGQKLKNAQF